MTKIRRLPKGYLRFIVEPTEDFAPTNWQQTPTAYQIVEFSGAVQMLGQADSWKFLHNHAALRTGNMKRWAIHIPLGPTGKISDGSKQSVGSSQFCASQ